jgi:hypothetical protein
MSRSVPTGPLFLCAIPPMAEDDGHSYYGGAVGLDDYHFEATDIMRWLRSLCSVSVLLGLAIPMADAQNAPLRFETKGLDHLLDCNIWNQPPYMAAGMLRELYVVQIPTPRSIDSRGGEREIKMLGRYFGAFFSTINGTFVMPYEFPLALWSEPLWTIFTTRIGSGIDFIPDGGNAQKVVFGILPENVLVIDRSPIGSWFDPPPPLRAASCMPREAGSVPQPIEPKKPSSLKGLFNK